jgi:hypothetical protein
VAIIIWGTRAKITKASCLYGATVARLASDQNVGTSNLSGHELCVDGHAVALMRTTNSTTPVRPCLDVWHFFASSNSQTRGPDTYATEAL